MAPDERDEYVLLPQVWGLAVGAGHPEPRRAGEVYVYPGYDAFYLPLFSDEHLAELFIRDAPLLGYEPFDIPHHLAQYNTGRIAKQRGTTHVVFDHPGRDHLTYPTNCAFIRIDDFIAVNLRHHQRGEGDG